MNTTNLPVVAIIGRPNVGKSTLYNALIGKKDALVANQPGVTRDRRFGEAKLNDRPYLLVDTGGLLFDETGIDEAMAQQSRQAARDADVVVFVVDAIASCHPADQILAQFLRTLKKPVILAVNKADGQEPIMALSDFYGLGFEAMIPVSSAHRRGLQELLELIEPYFDDSTPPVVDEVKEGEIRFAVVGRPNGGKSTLVNRIVGEDRVVVYDQPGTTMDSIDVSFERHGQKYTIIDTAGVRKKAKVTDGLEKFSVIKTLHAIRQAHVVVLVIDGTIQVTEQDLHLIGFAIEAGKALVVAVNKWDNLPSDQKESVREMLSMRLRFVDYARRLHISALHGTNVGQLIQYVQEAYRCSQVKLTTSQLTNLLLDAQKAHAPPLVKGRRIKMRYAHCGGHNPPIVVCHGNQLDSIPPTYERYLENFFREKLALVGTPIRFQMKTSTNPFEHIRNKLTPRQEYKKQRQAKRIRFFKRKEKKRSS